jgi:TPR repeat protein
MGRLADALWEGNLTPRDSARALSLYERAAAQGDRDARFSWARRLLESPTGREEVDKALGMLRELAAEGYPGAKERLGE